MARILIVDDEPSMRRVLVTMLKREQHEFVEAGGVQEARAALAADSFDVLLIDQKLPDGEGLSLLEQ